MVRLNAQALARLEGLVRKVADIRDNRVEANLQAISRMQLVDLPADRSFTHDDFLATQSKHTKKISQILITK